MTSDILALEGKLEIPTYLQNKVEVSTGASSSILYVGEARRLWFNGLDIRGQAVISRYDKSRETKSVVKATIVPPFVRREDTTFDKKSRAWSVWADEDHNPYYFLSNGKNTTGYDCSAHYRAALLGKAANQGLSLSHELFDLVFSPIDKEIFAMYEKVKSQVDRERKK